MLLQTWKSDKIWGLIEKMNLNKVNKKLFLILGAPILCTSDFLYIYYVMRIHEEGEYFVFKI